MPPGSSIKDTYHTYQEWLNETYPVAVYYYRIFVNEYNIKIEPPSVDDCNTCSMLKLELKKLKKNDPDSARVSAMQRELEIHLQTQQVIQDMIMSYAGN
ncbi:hypothetical protein PR048_005401 [Dryococelus australis]|uniref:Uncharacterized protein n=1 Tax=Dryococelus australis TaxID=614101 RepID=A0ABQ9I851_9NEOP|nr:hypothetical protein PR048_005401 [Dryococelus australis]